MEILDQSEVDALLSSATDAGARGGSADARPVFAPSGATAKTVDLPASLKLHAGAPAIRRLAPVRVPMIVRLAERRMSIDKILDLTVGTIVEFDRAADADLDLIANNMPIGTGNAVKCGEKFGLRVIRIEPWMQRIIAQGLYR